ncbi:IS607 family transposase [Desulfurococcaceae archaeon AG1]|nr:IS607 family transposase [Desulfurococcaceae archaeon AG1]
MSERLLRPKEVCEKLGVSYTTLRRWIESGYIRAIRTVGGKYRIPESEVRRLLEGRVKEVRAVVYARVSSQDQKEDLERQIKYLLEYCASKGYKVVEVLTDIASGLKTDRKGLRRLFDLITSRQAEVVVVTYRDRLARFGFEYLEYFLNQFGTRIEAVYGEEPKDAHRELVEDLIEIVTSFAGKLYGMRSHRKKRLVEGFEKLLEEVERA